MNYFPFYMEMSNKVCLIVGGGTIAYHKARILIDYPVEIRVVAHEIQNDFYALNSQLKDSTRLKLEKRNFQVLDLLQADFVIAATDDMEFNLYLAEECRKHHKLINVVDVPDASDFIFPAIWRKRDLMIAVSTGGKSPLFAAELKKELNELIPDYYCDLVEMLGEIREYLKESVPMINQRKLIYHELIRECKTLGRALNQKEIDTIIEEIMKNRK